MHAGFAPSSVEAAEQAIASSLLDVTIDGARGILFNVTGGTDLTLFDVNDAAEIIRKTAEKYAEAEQRLTGHGKA
mgnify:CR=1 FL=1